MYSRAILAVIKNLGLDSVAAATPCYDQLPECRFMLVVTEYRKIGYSIADAFHLNPRYGKRIFTVDTKDIGTDDMKIITQAAKDAAPDGYQLYKCEQS